MTQYINARSKRLLIPYLFAILFIIPPQKYLIALYNAHFRGHTINYCLHYFNYNPPWIDRNLRFLSYYGYHLWYLGFLFIFSLIVFPLFKFLKREASRNFIPRISLRCVKWGGIFLLVIPIAIIQVTLRATYPQYLVTAQK